MRKKHLTIFFTTLSVIFVTAGETRQPQAVKVIAPDLIIETAEQGAFFDDPVDPRHFKPLNVVPQPHRFLFGWRMRVKTTRKLVHVQERSVDGKGKQGIPFVAEPKYGYIYNATDITTGVGPGKSSMTVFVENVPVKTFTSEVKALHF